MLHVTTEIKTVERAVCDFCYGDDAKECPGCRRHVCRTCGTWWDVDPWTGIDNGDYWDLVCGDCLKKAEPFTRQAREIRDDAEQKLDALRRQWETECK